MAVAAPAHLPGIAFEAVAPAVGDPLPRMDIGGFVGFAAAGPLHVPVAVEDVRGFRTVFGPDVVVAIDGETAEHARSHLGPAVEAFFANGGQRCWVVRVADEAVVGRAVVDVPGLVAFDGTTGRVVAGAQLRAASAGPAATTLTVTALQQVVPVAARPRISAGARALTLPPGTGVVRGDLLRVRHRGGAVLVAATATATLAGRTTVDVTPIARHTVLRADDLPEGAVRATVLGADLRVVDLIVTRGDRPTVRGDVAPDDVVVWDRGDGAAALLRIGDDVGAGHHRIDDAHRLAPLRALPALSAAPIEIVRIGLRVHDRDETIAAISGLVVDPASARSWAALPVDEARYGARTHDRDRRHADEPRRLGDRPGDGDERHADEAWSGADATGATGLRRPVPLAGPATVPHGVSWLPLLPTDPRAAPRLPLRADGPAATRDGLAAFGAHLFVDPDLASLGTRLLRTTAEQIAHLSDAPRRLRGVHALLDVGEVSMVAVPDAGHPGWDDLAPPSQDPPPDPPRIAPPELVEGCRVRVSWPGVARAVSATVEMSTSADFLDPAVRLDVPAPGADTDTAAVVDVDVPCTCRERWWVRVRVADDAGQVGPWSTTASLLVPDTDFDPCTVPSPPPLLRLEVAGDTTDGMLSWVAPGRGWGSAGQGLRIELQRAPEPTFGDPVTVVVGGDRRPLRRPAHGAVYVRIRIADGPPGATAWSNTEVLHAAPLTRRVLRRNEPNDPSATLLAVHRAVARLCVARGDLVAFLSTAGHHDTAGAHRHVAALAGPAAAASTAVATAAVDAPTADDATGGVGPLDRSEVAALSHVVVMHPWVLAGRADRVVATPPDGAVCGVVARRTFDGGAWLSPGGQPLRGVLGTVALDDTEAPERLTTVGLNVVARDPHDEVLLTAHTLAADDAVRPVGVRRLLILLRRLALRHGTTYVFEPNGPRFHAMVRRTFEELLSGLHERGALVGATPTQAYRVVADATVNTPAALDAGRFVVELHVAAAQPLEFIRVRLVQTGPGAVTVTEVTR